MNRHRILFNDHHNIQPEIIVASKQTWDSLSEDDQTIIRAAMVMPWNIRRNSGARKKRKTRKS